MCMDEEMKSENRDGEDEKGVDIAWWSILLGYLEEVNNFKFE